MKCKQIFIALSIALCSIALMSYTPLNWSLKHAQTDIEDSDLIAIVRVVALQQDEEAIIKEKGLNDEILDTIWRDYSAELLILKCVKPDQDKNLRYQAGSRIKIFVGGDLSERSHDPLKIDPASPSLTMHNTQNGYDLRIGQTYMICLSKNKQRPYPFSPRSGPFSIYWLQSNDSYRRKTSGEYGEIQEGFSTLLESIEARLESTLKKSDKPEP